MILKKIIDDSGFQIVSDDESEAIREAEKIYKISGSCSVIFSKNLYYIESPAMIVRIWERLIWKDGKEIKNEF